MCKWGGYNPEEVTVDAPTSLTFGIPDAALLKELVTGFATTGIIPIDVVHKYLVASGLLDQTISLKDYLTMIEENKKLRKELGLTMEKKEGNSSEDKTGESSESKEGEDKDPEKKGEKEETTGQ